MMTDTESYGGGYAYSQHSAPISPHKPRMNFELKNKPDFTISWKKSKMNRSSSNKDHSKLFAGNTPVNPSVYISNNNNNNNNNNINGNESVGTNSRPFTPSNKFEIKRAKKIPISQRIKNELIANTGHSSHKLIFNSNNNNENSRTNSTKHTMSDDDHDDTESTEFLSDNAEQRLLRQVSSNGGIERVSTLNNLQLQAINDEQPKTPLLLNDNNININNRDDTRNIKNKNKKQSSHKKKRSSVAFGFGANDYYNGTQKHMLGSSNMGSSIKSLRLSVNTDDKKRRKSLFNYADNPFNITNPYTPMFDQHNSISFDQSKWNINELNSMETLQEFRQYMSNKSKDDIIELCWNLINHTDKVDELLSMVSDMNENLDKNKSLTRMLNTVCLTLNSKYASIYILDDDSKKFMKLLWTSNGEPYKDVIISLNNNKTQIPSRIYQKNCATSYEIKKNDVSLCPDYDGFGNFYILGIPIQKPKTKETIGVLCVYRDRSKNVFNKKDQSSGQILCSIAAATLQNITKFANINEKEKHTSRILDIIDEMSGDVSQGYGNIIKKIVRKIKTLVTCDEIDFWAIDHENNKILCEYTQNNNLNNIKIDLDRNTVLGEVGLTGKYIKIDNTRYDTRYNKYQLQFTKKNTESLLIIPVKPIDDDKVLGIIQATNK